jgi:glucosyl-dolichyl phosphate glucuronosyltransferase
VSPSWPQPKRSSLRPELGAVDVSVVICTCWTERWDDLVGAIESVRSQTVRPRELVLVVDHNPGLARRARERWADVSVVENARDIGLSNARNAGIDHAKGEVVAFLDDDAVAEPQWLENMLPAYAEDSVIGVGGSIEPLWNDSRPAWFPEEFGWVVGCTYTGLPDRPTAVRNVIGTNMSFRRDVFDVIGGFESRIGQVGASPIRCDETELCVRARQRWPERSIVYDPRVRVTHRVTARRTQWGYFVSRCYVEGRSKAVVARLVGSRDALSSELGYATRVLPAGVARGVRDALLRSDRAGWGRAAAIVVGFAAAVAGFAAGRIGGSKLAFRRAG